MTISAFAYNEALEEYTLTPLEAGIVYELAPIGWEGLENINLHFACKGGSVRVFSEDEEVQLSMRNGGLFRDHREARNYGYELDHPVVTMELTLTQLEDEDSYEGKASATFSIEITSVAYSDRYQICWKGNDRQLRKIKKTTTTEQTSFGSRSFFFIPFLTSYF